MNLQYGSQGDEVKKLQQQLNKNGYSLSEDGIFGANTDAAVRDYQTKNGLTSDGIVGSLTSGKLYGAAETQQTAETPAAPETPKSNADWYKPSDAVEQYRAALEAQTGTKPAEFDSGYKDKMDALYDQIMGREKFSYDLNGDMLYRQYADQYRRLGQQAMQDTMAQAAGLTGGYGSTYAQQAGQQSYNSYLQQLNDKVPELYQLARDAYDREGAELMDRAELARQGYMDDYSMYRDTVNDWNTERDYLTNRYDSERGFDYDTQYAGWNRENDLSDQARAQAYDEASNLLSMGIMPDDALLEAAGMSASYARQMAAAIQAQMAAGGSGGSGGGGGPKKTPETDTFEERAKLVSKNIATAANGASNAGLSVQAELAFAKQKLDTSNAQQVAQYQALEKLADASLRNKGNPIIVTHL